MNNFAKKGTMTIGPPARCARHKITLSGHIKTNVYNFWTYVPTIISDQDSDLIGVRIPETQDVREEKAQHKSLKWHCKLLGK